MQCEEVCPTFWQVVHITLKSKKGLEYTLAKLYVYRQTRVHTHTLAVFSPADLIETTLETNNMILG